MAKLDKHIEIGPFLRDVARDALEKCAKPWCRLLHERETFVECNTGRVALLFRRGLDLEFRLAQLELVYVPSNAECGGFDGLLRMFHEIRVVNGCKSSRERQDKLLWDDYVEVFDGFGLDDDGGYFVLVVHSLEGLDGLFFTGSTVEEQIEEASRFFAVHPGTCWVTLGVYVSMGMIRVVEGLVLPDTETFTRLLQYGQDGFMETVYGLCVSCVCTSGDGRLCRFWSHGGARPSEGVRFVIREVGDKV